MKSSYDEADKGLSDYSKLVPLRRGSLTNNEKLNTSFTLLRLNSRNYTSNFELDLCYHNYRIVISREMRFSRLSWLANRFLKIEVHIFDRSETS